jgi:hypothetical protein
MSLYSTILAKQLMSDSKLLSILVLSQIFWWRWWLSYPKKKKSLFFIFLLLDTIGFETYDYFLPSS